MDADPWCLNEKTSHPLPFVVNPVVVGSAGFLLDSSCAICLRCVALRCVCVCLCLQCTQDLGGAEFSP